MRRAACGSRGGNAVVAAALLVIGGLGRAAASPLPGAPLTQGFISLAGEEASRFQLPADLVAVREWSGLEGETTTRYQQVVHGAAVLGGQITVTRDAGGVAIAVIGAHFPRIPAAPAPVMGAARARGIAQRELGSDGEWQTLLRLDPLTGGFFYQVESVRLDSRPVRWIDATSGATVKAFDALAHGDGVGVKGDVKTVDSRPAAAGGFELVSPDGRRRTYDARLGSGQVAGTSRTLMTDEDDHWDLQKAFAFPGDQRAGVDAHQYADVVTDFYDATFGRDSFDDAGATIHSVVHYGSNYCNAFWNGLRITYGDGWAEGTCLPFSGALDIVAHELTHGVTDYTSNLTYYEEPGALNEAFSDIMGTVAERWAHAEGRDPAGAPDWLIGDEVLATNRFIRLRNLADPAEGGYPSHYSLRFIGTDDNGYVHSNSSIANHAFYLAAEGGRNAGCTAQNGHPATHSANCDVVVAGIGMARAAEIFYQGFTSLPEHARFCDARNAMVALAGADHQAISDAWAAVGVDGECATPCVGDDSASIPFESPHPYGNDGDCTWTYDNGGGGFAFHFSLLDTEDGWDYVYVSDAFGNVLATYTGESRHAVTSPCIATPVGSVRLVSDAFVSAPGFVVDAVVACEP